MVSLSTAAGKNMSGNRSGANYPMEEQNEREKRQRQRERKNKNKVREDNRQFCWVQQLAAGQLEHLQS